MSENLAAPDESQSVSGENKQTIFENARIGGNVRIDSITQTIINQAQPQSNLEPKHFNVPYLRNDYFTGREEVLTQLHEALGQTGTAAISQAKAISGLGGVGKTQTAVEYAYRYFYDRPCYDWVLWVNASNLTLVSSFGALATDLALPNHRENKLDENIAAVSRWLETTDSWLLIFDNVDDPQIVKPFRPKNPKGRILITSRVERLESLGVRGAIALDTMTPEEAEEFLLRRTERSPLAPLKKGGTEPDTPQVPSEPENSEPDTLKVPLLKGDLGGSTPIDSSEQQSIATLAATLGYLPLALEQAAAYILAKGIRFDAYLRSYQKRRLQLLEKEKPQTGDYPESVATTWTINFEAVQANSEAAADLLRVSAFLAPNNIPYEILYLGKDQLGAALSAALVEVAEDELVIPELLEELTRYSLIRLETDDRYSIHRMVQEVLQDVLADQRQEWIDRTVAALNETFPSAEFENWGWCDRLIEHVLAIDLQQATGTIELGRLLNQTGYFLSEQGFYSEAEPLYLQSLDIIRLQLGDDYSDTATSLNCLASLYQAQGRYSEAKPLYLQALDIRRSQLGHNHLDTATALSNLASLYQAQGRYSEAEPLYLQALDIRRSQLGETHVDTATNLSNLASLYHSQRCDSEAESLFLQALNIKQSQLGDDHPDIVTVLNDLALLYHSQERYDEAEPLLLQALNVSCAQLGDDHPNTAIKIDNLASLYRSQGRYKDAEALHLRALEVIRDRLGANHPDTASALENLAGLYFSQKRYEEAESFFLQALEIRYAQAGEPHPHIATTLNNLALLYQSQKRYEEAEAHYLQALEMLYAKRGPDHTFTAFTLDNLAALYRTQGRYEEAESLCLQALEISRVRLGDHNPDTAIVRNRLASIYMDQKRYKEAEALYLQTLEILMQTLGENHPNTQTTWNGFICLLQQALASGRSAELSDDPLTQDLLRELSSQSE